MTKFIVAFLMIIFVQASFAFELDSFKSGMTIEQAKTLIEKSSYDKVEIKDNHIGAWDAPQKGTHRGIYLNFCKGKLVQVQKHLKPRFDYFVRLLDEKRRELGRPLDAWSRPTNVTSNFEENSISFFWKDGPTLIQVSYHDFGSNTQLDITYEIGNECWKSLY